MTSSSYANAIKIMAENYPPYGYENKDGKIIGLSTEIVQFIVEDSGIRVDSWVIAPWARAFFDTKNNPNTVLYTVVRNPEREKMFHWIGPISDRNIYLYKLKRRSEITVDTIEDAKRYIIGSVIDTATTDLLLSKGAKPHIVPHHDKTVKMLLVGHLDLVPHLEYSLAFIAKKFKAKFSDFEPVLLLDGSKKYYIVLNKDSSPSIVKKFRTSFKKLKANSGLTKIQQKYLK